MSSSSDFLHASPTAFQGDAIGPGQSAAAEGLESRLDLALGALETLAGELEGQPEALLSLLRRLEAMHRTIQDGPFRASLPADRGALFQVLSEMERSGGWPYIPRLQLRTFLDLLGAEVGAEALLQGEGLHGPGPGGDAPSSLAA